MKNENKGNLLAWADKLSQSPRTATTTPEGVEGHLVVMLTDEAANALAKVLRQANHRLVFMHEELQRQGYEIRQGGK